MLVMMILSEPLEEQYHCSDTTLEQVAFDFSINLYSIK